MHSRRRPSRPDRHAGVETRFGATIIPAVNQPVTQHGARRHLAAGCAFPKACNLDRQAIGKCRLVSDAMAIGQHLDRSFGLAKIAAVVVAIKLDRFDEAAGAQFRQQAGFVEVPTQ